MGQPPHHSCRVDVVDPDERTLEPEGTGGASHEPAAERLVRGCDGSFETKRQRGRRVGHVQAFSDTPDVSARNRRVGLSSPRSAYDSVGEGHRPIDEEHSVCSGQARHVLVKAQPVRVPGHTGDADDVAVSKHQVRTFSSRLSDSTREPSLVASGPTIRSTVRSSSSPSCDLYLSFWLVTVHPSHRLGKSW